MLEIKDFSVYIGTKCIIESFHLCLNQGDKLAIIGEEGNGKSTLLQTLIGQCPYAEISGSIQTRYRLGYLEQMISEKYSTTSVFDYLFSSMEEYYERVNLLYTSIRELSFDSKLLDRKQISTLSGGEKVKLQLLRLLLEDADILLLDEPTNDLDISTLEWLEQFILKSKKPIIYVSHDETLLGRTANRILHLELVQKKNKSKWTLFEGGYLEYVKTRFQAIQKQTQMAKKEQSQYQRQKEKLNQIKNKVEHQLNTITRADPHGAQLLKKKMKTVKAQERRMGEKDLIEIPDQEESIRFFFQTISFDHQKVITSFSVLNRSDDVFVFGNTHLSITGKNGIGKTTLLKKVYANLEEQGYSVGLMPQNYDDFLGEETPIQFLTRTGEKEEQTFLRSCMGNMNFTKEEMIGFVKDLSGGSKAKLFLLRLMLQKHPILLLDEPTRNVSPLSNPVIRNALKEYPGALISVSHDRLYLEEVSHVILELTEDGMILQ